MSSLVVLGADGFVGRALLASDGLPERVVAVARRIPPHAGSSTHVVWAAADLNTPGSLDEIVRGGDVIINLAYMSGAGEAENLGLVDNVIGAAIRAGASRLVHCSTAVVAGRVSEAVVDESTRCRPVTGYERAKLAVERRLLASTGIDVGILRPTAIIGRGSSNLLKLVREIQSDGWMRRYIRASLFGRRKMHLVPVRNVTAALLHLANHRHELSGNVYIASSDDDPDNNFAAVESVLTEAFGRRRGKIKPLPVPAGALSLLLRLMARSDIYPNRIYSGSKLARTGFIPPQAVLDSVREFAEGIQSDER